MDEILEELKRIQREIDLLHKLKDEHRRVYGCWIGDISYYALGRRRCEKCQEWSDQQNCLRSKKKALCDELYRLSYGMDPIKLLKIDC